MALRVEWIIHSFPEFVIGDDLIVNPTEELGINLDLELAFFRKGNAQVLWTNDNLNWLEAGAMKRRGQRL